MRESPHTHLTNWGRWGREDEQGCLNLLTPERIKQAAGLIKTGQAYSLAVPLEANGPQAAGFHKPWKVTEYKEFPTGLAACIDTLIIHTHSGTHIDPLCHVWYDNHLYNGFRASEHISTAGVTRNAIDQVPFLIGRGVLLDIAGWKGVDHLEVGAPITAADLDQCAAVQQVTVHPGDMVVVRTGWLSVFYTDPALYSSGEPGLDATTLPWLKKHDIVAVGADNWGVEALAPLQPSDMPVHRGATRDLGVYLVENLTLEEVAAHRVYEFLLVIAPLRLTGGAGSPVNPIAIT